MFRSEGKYTLIHNSAISESSTQWNNSSLKLLLTFSHRAQIAFSNLKTKKWVIVFKVQCLKGIAITTLQKRKRTFPISIYEQANIPSNLWFVYMSLCLSVVVRADTIYVKWYLLEGSFQVTPPEGFVDLCLDKSLPVAFPSWISGSCTLLFFLLSNYPLSYLHVPYSQ